MNQIVIHRILQILSSTCVPHVRVSTGVSHRCAQQVCPTYRCTYPTGVSTGVSHCRYIPQVCSTGVFHRCVHRCVPQVCPIYRCVPHVSPTRVSHRFISQVCPIGTCTSHTCVPQVCSTGVFHRCVHRCVP